ncbi:MAG TPA: outer membrane beta-barrel protein [Flavobacteriales bacterium]|nr:outer membrane beta-barrel protein [Flavobacteriales bacterium]
MVKKIALSVALFTTLCAQAQYTRTAGSFELGMRNTVSLFGNNNTAGFGTGGQFRIMLGKQLNTEWFADYIQTDLYAKGKRTDAHIGWSVMFYLLNEPKKLDPYIIAGHCFDYTRVNVYRTLTEPGQEYKSRWSSAAQAGIGCHYYIGQRFNLSLSTQYMLHLGNDIHAELESENGTEVLHVEQTDTNNKLTFEGHMLTTLSLNFRIGQLWGER